MRHRISGIADTAERLCVIALYGSLVARAGMAVFSGLWIDGYVIISEGLVLVALLLRKHTIDISLRSRDWAVAFIGTTLPLMVRPANVAHLVPIGVCAGLLLAGIIVATAAKISLWRNFGVVAANRGIICGGAYRYVRHPMYLGYMLSHLGFWLSTPTLWNAVVYAGAATAFIARILAEERLLLADRDYQTFCQSVRWRLIPGVF